MPTIDFAAIGGIIADLLVNITTYAGIAALLYAIGGILIRTVSWTFDKMLIGFIATMYRYFETIIKGTLLTDSIVKGMMDRVYLLVGVFVVFRLGMLIFSYIINPSEVMDEKVGVSALVKRIILGLILILFMPNIFNFAFRMQNAILNDQIIERIIMPEADIQKVNSYKEKHGMGKIIGMTIFQGFFNVSGNGGSSGIVKANYKKAMDIGETYDLSVIDTLGSGLSAGILYEVGDEYAFDYFPIFSTVVLCYVLYLLVQYCLDAVVRSLKLSVLQVIAPITIVEYMINGDKNEVFKSWRKAVISTFAMLFMRVASIWFVAYVTLLMQPGALNEPSLLTEKDFLLKAIIVLGLLAFMMDFPKMMSDVFGLDLDQSGSVKNVMGKAMGAAAAGLAVGGAVAGLGMKAAGAAKGTIKGGLSNLAGKDSSFAKGLNNPIKTGLGQSAALMGKIPGISHLSNKLASSEKSQKFAAGVKEVGGAFASAAKANHLGSTLKTGAMAVGAAVLASNSVTKSAAGGYQQTSGAVDNKVKAQEEKSAQAAYQQQTIQLAEQTMDAIGNIKVRTQTGSVDVEPSSFDVKNVAEQARGQVISDSGGYSSTATGGTIEVSDFGRNTTYRENRSNETEIQQRINDVVHVHDEMSPTERSEYIANSAFANMTNDEFRAHQEGVDRLIKTREKENNQNKDRKTANNSDNIETL